MKSLLVPLLIGLALFTIVVKSGGFRPASQAYKQPVSSAPILEMQQRWQEISASEKSAAKIKFINLPALPKLEPIPQPKIISETYQEKQQRIEDEWKRISEKNIASLQAKEAAERIQYQADLAAIELKYQASIAAIQESSNSGSSASKNVTPSPSSAPLPSAPLDPSFNLMNSPIELRGIPGSPWQHDINSSTTYRVTPIPGGGVRLER